MKFYSIKKMAAAALFAALICIATMIVLTYAPSGGGYIHLGDCFVLLAGWILGPLWGAAAAAVGSSLTDIIVGAAVYVPVTFVVKGLMAAVAFWIMNLLMSRSRPAKALKYVLSATLAELIMVAGYFTYEYILYGTGATANIILNLIQGASGVVLASLLVSPLMKISYIRMLHDKK